MTPADTRRASEVGTPPGPEGDEVLTELFSDAGRRDPYRCYARLRELAPIHTTADGSVVLTRHDDCAAVLRNPEMRTADGDPDNPSLPGWRERPATRTLGTSLLVRNPPEHTRLREPVQGAFTPRRVALLEERVDAMVARCLDDVAAAGADGGTVNIRDLLAYPLPSAVIASLLGVPEGDWDDLIEPMAAFVPALDLSVPQLALDLADDAARALVPYFTDLVDARRAEPRDDLISMLATADGADPIPVDDLVPTVIFMYAAGFTTTVGLLTNGLLALLRHPDQRRLLHDDPDLLGAAVDECLRYDTPVQAVSRMAARDVEIGGTTIPVGSKVNPFLGAANRDPEHFVRPDSFWVMRPGPRNISFGGGLHFCLGSALARLEGRLVFRALFSRFPRLELAGEPVLSPEFNFRSYSHLPVTVN